MKQILKLGALAVAAAFACAANPVHAAAAQASAATQATANSEAGKQLNAVADEYYDALARFDPVSAGESGDNRFYDQLGMSIGRILRVQASEARAHRQAAAEEWAMKTPVKMLFPTVIFFFPALFTVLLGPAIMNFGRML